MIPKLMTGQLALPDQHRSKQTNYLRKKPMKKSFFLSPLFILAVIHSSISYASGGEGRGHGHARGHHKHHHSDEARYYPEPHRYSNHQDPRSHQGLAGGVVGSVLGYELGNGDPIATGLGAAAGSYVGNGVAGRR
jgi:hypothetical protein